MKQTTKYQLNLMESGDAFSPDPLNENTQALENALVEHNSDENAHSALRTTVAEHTADKNNPHAVTAAQVGAAAASHNHSAAAITSGTLPVSRGGTGNTSVDSTPTSGSKKMVTSGGVYTALEGKAAAGHSHSEYAAASHSHSEYAAASHSHSGYAAASHSHGAGSITSGTLPVSRGGTGNSSVDSTPVSGSSKMVTSGGVYTALSKKYGTDNAPWVVGSYTGTGVIGTALNISLGFQPSAVVVLRADGTIGFGLCVRSGNSQGAMTSAKMSTATNSYTVFNDYMEITSTGFSVLKYHENYVNCPNMNNVPYVYIAFK